MDLTGNIKDSDTSDLVPQAGRRFKQFQTWFSTALQLHLEQAQEWCQILQNHLV